MAFFLVMWVTRRQAPSQVSLLFFILNIQWATLKNVDWVEDTASKENISLILRRLRTLELVFRILPHFCLKKLFSNVCCKALLFKHSCVCWLVGFIVFLVFDCFVGYSTRTVNTWLDLSLWPTDDNDLYQRNSDEGQLRCDVSTRRLATHGVCRW